jgi:hypothetical protein
VSVFPQGRLWHFRLVLATASKGQQQITATMLHQCRAQFLERVSGNVMEGAIPYIHWHKDDLKALTWAQKLLNRCQDGSDDVIPYLDFQIPLSTK